MDPHHPTNPMRSFSSISPPLQLPWTRETDPEFFAKSEAALHWTNQAQISEDCLHLNEVIVPNFNGKGPLPAVNWTKAMIQLVLKHLHSRILTIWGLFFTEEMWQDIHRTTAVLNKEFPLEITFQEVIFIVRILALVETVEWTPVMEECRLEKGDVRDHNRDTAILNERYGDNGENRITPYEAYRKLIELRFSGETGFMGLWTDPMIKRLKELCDQGLDVDEITDELFEELGKPKFREDTQLKLLQTGHADAHPNSPSGW